MTSATKQLHTDMQNSKLNFHAHIYKTNVKRQFISDINLTVRRGWSKQFPIPKEQRGTMKDHEDRFSVMFAVWVLRGAQTLVSARPMKPGKLSYS